MQISPQIERQIACGESEHRTIPSTPTKLTREARIYGVREIARRAGVSDDLISGWRIEITDRSTLVSLDPNGKKKICFPFDMGNQGLSSADIKSKPARATWAYPPPTELARLTPDFVIPFVGTGNTDGKMAMFRCGNPDSIEFNFDLLTTAVWTLARAEEIVELERDAHGRFPASASMAVREHFLHRPIVDEYGFAFAQALSCLLPGWSPQRGPFRVKLSHDIDEVGIPFSLRTTLGHTLRRGKPSATIEDLLSSFTEQYPVYLAAILEVARLSLEYDVNSAFYWKASSVSEYDSGYNPDHPKIKRAMRWLFESGFENGVHPGYETFGSIGRLSAEVAAMRQCLGQIELGGRQHYLRWNPQTWRHWESCGLAYDSSVGFAERIGFRAGTCVPYQPWLFAENREANLLEIPLLVMDRTLNSYMRLGAERSLELVADCIERCRSVGGVFTLLWHNDALIEPSYGELYPRILSRVLGSPRFDWKASRLSHSKN